MILSARGAPSKRNRRRATRPNEALANLAANIIENPETPGDIGDFVNAALGKDYGPIPWNWASIIGSAVGQLGPEIYEKVKESVPR